MMKNNIYFEIQTHINLNLTKNKERSTWVGMYNIWTTPDNIWQQNEVILFVNFMLFKLGYVLIMSKHVYMWIAKWNYLRIRGHF